MPKSYDPTPPANRVLSITIPRPHKIPKSYGIYSTTANTTNLMVRMSGYERELIEEAAGMCGIKLSTFVRWVTVFAARELARQERGYCPTAGWIYEVEQSL